MGRTVPAPRVESRIELADGRHIGLAEYGVPDGRAVLWFHGTPGGRRQMPVFGRDAAAERGIRLVLLERPGVGGSTPHTYPSLVGWARDVDECADRLGIDRCAVAGLSGGGPYALACAHELGDRVVSTAVLNGVAPTQGDDAIPGGLVALATLARPVLHPLRAPLGVGLWAFFRAIKPVGTQAFELYVSVSPPGDKQVFRLPGMRDMFLDDIGRCGRRQFGAAVFDLVQFTRDWGFSPRHIAVRTHFWHGDADPIVPLDHGEHLAAMVPGAELRIRPGESHLGSLQACEEVFDVLLADWTETTQGAPLRHRDRS